MATSEPIPPKGVATGAALKDSEGVGLSTGSPGLPDEDGASTVDVTDADGEAEGRLTGAVVAGADGGVTGSPDDGRGPEGTTAPDVGTGSWGMTALVMGSEGTLLPTSDASPDVAGGGRGAYDIGCVGAGPGSETHCVTVTVTVVGGAQLAVHELAGDTKN